MKIIAELAQGFEGSLEKAKLLLKASANSKADIAKFQLVYADELATPSYKYYKLFKSLEMEDNHWRELVNYSKELGIELNFDVFGIRSLNLCETLGIKGIKLHGTDITNLGLLKLVSKSKIQNIYLGAGGSNLNEIIKAISILSNKNVVILLGFQSYPTENVDNHISRVKYLYNHFLSQKNIEIGFADHALPEFGISIPLSTLAIGAGASVIEKHLTLGKIMKMEDYESALNPDEFLDFVLKVKECFLAYGFASDKNDFGMSKAEIGYRKTIRRHVTANKDLKKGKKLRPEDLVLKRTQSDKYIYDLNNVYDRELKQDVKKNMAIQKHMLK